MTKPSQPQPQRHTVVRQAWLESECGWGCRPDGWSYHLNMADRSAFIDAYWKSMPDSTPEEYSRPDGTPQLTDVSPEGFREISEQAPGIRLYQIPDWDLSLSLEHKKNTIKWKKNYLEGRRKDVLKKTEELNSLSREIETVETEIKELEEGLA